MANIISKINVGGTEYDIHDARITGGVLNFRGISTDSSVQDGAAVTTTQLDNPQEGDVVIRGSKELVIVNVGSTTTPSLQ